MSTTRTIVRGLAAAATVGGLVLGLAGTATALPSVPSAPESGTSSDEAPPADGDPLYRPFYSDVHYRVVSEDGGNTFVPVPISSEEWRDVYQYAEPIVLEPIILQKHRWSPVIVATVLFPGADNPYSEAITSAEWARTGYWAFDTVRFVNGDEVVKWGTSDEIFLVAVNGEFHKLTFAEWAAIEFYGPTFDEVDQGFLKLTWNDAIAGMDSLSAGSGVPITYDEWASYAFPTPRAQQRITGDVFQQDCGDPAIYYYGPTLEREITFGEWQAAGTPAPDVFC